MNLVDCKSALKTLRSGLPIIFPTDTLPAIGCLPKFSNVIYEFKKRDRKKPLILMGSEDRDLFEYVHNEHNWIIVISHKLIQEDTFSWKNLDIVCREN